MVKYQALYPMNYVISAFFGLYKIPFFREATFLQSKEDRVKICRDPDVPVLIADVRA